jgi:hypothetical protein
MAGIIFNRKFNLKIKPPTYSNSRCYEGQEPHPQPPPISKIYPFLPPVAGGVRGVLRCNSYNWKPLCLRSWGSRYQVFKLRLFTQKQAETYVFINCSKIYISKNKNEKIKIPWKLSGYSRIRGGYSNSRCTLIKP